VFGWLNGVVDMNFINPFLQGVIFVVIVARTITAHTPSEPYQSKEKQKGEDGE